MRPSTRKSDNLSTNVRSQPSLDELHEVAWAASDTHPRGLERRDLFGRRTRRPGDDRARVTHAATRWCRLAGDESDYRLLHVLLHEDCRVLFVGAADLAHHRHGLRRRI